MSTISPASRRAQRGCDVGGEHGGAEQDGGVAAVLHDARDRVDGGLWQAGGERLVIGQPDARRAIPSERGRSGVVEAGAADDGIDLHAERRAEPRSLREQAERAGGEDAVVLLCEDEHVTHQISFRSARNATI